MRVSIATGRSWEHFVTVVGEVRNSLSPCIVSGGSQIVDVTNGAVLWEVRLMRQQINELNLIAAKYGKELSYNDKLKTYGPVDQIPTTSHTTIAYLLNIDSVELEEIHNEVSAIEGLHSAITQAWDDTGFYALHITSLSANKGAALLKLVDITSVSAQEVVAIGDGLNDVPMFEVAGSAYSIAGSVVEGHKYTKGSIPSVVDEGLAKFIIKLYN